MSVDRRWMLRRCLADQREPAEANYAAMNAQLVLEHPRYQAGCLAVEMPFWDLTHLDVLDYDHASCCRSRRRDADACLHCDVEA